MVVKKHPPGKGKNRDQYNGRSIRVAASGTIVGASSTTVAAGDTTLILTVSGGIWLPADAGFADQRQGILDGITGDDDFATVIAEVAVTDVVRTSDTVVTVTFPASAYSPSGAEAVTVAIPAGAFYLTDTPRITTRTPSNTPITISVPVAASEGPLYPGTIAEVAGPSSLASWTNITNMQADDGSVATATPGAAMLNSTKIASCTNFGFAIPDGATITGVIVEVERFRTDNGGGCRDFASPASFGLLNEATVISDSKAAAGAWPTTATVATYGASDDLWGATLTAAIINDSTFGFQFQAGDSSPNNDVANVDFVRMTVHYTT